MTQLTKEWKEFIQNPPIKKEDEKKKEIVSENQRRAVNGK